MTIPVFLEEARPRLFRARFVPLENGFRLGLGRGRRLAPGESVSLLRAAAIHNQDVQYRNL